MNTGSYIKPEIIISKVAIMVGDTEFNSLPRPFYNSLVQQAFEKLALATFFDEKRADIDLNGSLVHDLPKDCFNVINVYIYSGTSCDITKSHKVWWKRNYYTRGNGYIANHKGNNAGDPFFDNSNSFHRYGQALEARGVGIAHQNLLYYNFQNGNIMLSSSCLSSGNKLHIHYHGTGCAVDEAPIIPIFLREAMEDYVITQALLARIANDNGDVRKWQALYQIHDAKLSHPFTGSWVRAEEAVKSMNSSQRSELKDYLSKAAWANDL
jgi:hypothetical protein